MKDIDFFKIEKQMLELVLAAQASSEVGKGYYYDTYLLTSGNSKHRARMGYASKIDCEVRAIELINLLNSLKYRYGIKRELTANYFVDGSPDQNGYPSYIVYYDFKIAGMRYQISFHNPEYQVMESKLRKYIGKGRKTRWNRHPGGSQKDISNLISLFYEVNGYVTINGE